jgi:hypothetical protein
VLDRLREAPEVVRAGVSASAEQGVGLVVEDGFEGYVRAGELDGIVERFGLDDRAARPNVLLRVIEEAAWPFRRGQRAAGRAVVAVDLLESDDPRARRAGAELLGPQ